MSQYGKNEFDITLINACGEWDEYLDYFRNNGVSVYNFKYKFYKYLPKEGFIQSTCTCNKKDQIVMLDTCRRTTR